MMIKAPLIQIIMISVPGCTKNDLICQIKSTDEKYLIFI